MKKCRILAAALLAGALAVVALQVVQSVAYHRPVSTGFNLYVLVLLVSSFSLSSFVQRREKRLREYAEASAWRIAHGVGSAGSSPREYPDLLVAMEVRLSLAGYTVTRGVRLPTGDIADLVASRVEFTIPGLINAPMFQHLFLRRVKTATLKDYDALFEAGYRYARDTHRSSVLRRKRFGHVVLPCLAVDSATPSLIAAASRRPPKRWLRFELPILYDLSAGRTYYYSGKTPALGSMLLPGARALANLAFGIEHPSVVA